MKSRHGDTERKEGKITNDTNQQITRIIRDIRPSPAYAGVKFVISLFFSVPLCLRGFLFLVATYLILMIWDSAVAVSDGSNDSQQSPEQEVHQLEEASVTPGRFSISESAQRGY